MGEGWDASSRRKADFKHSKDGPEEIPAAKRRKWSKKKCKKSKPSGQPHDMQLFDQVRFKTTTFSLVGYDEYRCTLCRHKEIVYLDRA